MYFLSEIVFSLDAQFGSFMSSLFLVNMLKLFSTFLNISNTVIITILMFLSYNSVICVIFTDYFSPFYG